tara:strand:- start:1129 stop:1239 length:111 start_codon:yes stop_codon:yes gene_type:complete
MPYGKGTYGKTRGRPPVKKVSRKKKGRKSPVRKKKK